MKKVVVSVTNDLTTDQRVDRTCTTLVKMGFDVLLIGRKRKGSLPLKSRIYRIKRMHLFFDKGPAFYAEYNIRLFFLLLFLKADLYLSNDLDTLLSNHLASGIRNRPLFHDCHEYFRGVPELNGRKTTTRIWKFIEDRIFPKLKNVYAVNESVATLYRKEYGNKITVIRNVPFTRSAVSPKSKVVLGIDPTRKIILYQGAVNIDRGLEEAILAMKFTRTPATLVILGTGDIMDKLKKMILAEGLNDRVLMTGPVPLEELHSYTCMADIGLSIEKNVSINYYYSLPNKFLDYIQANVPVLVSPFPEMTKLVEKYRIGEMIGSHEPVYLAEKFDSILNDEEKLSMFRKNLIIAARELCWENEEAEFIKIFQPYA